MADRPRKRTRVPGVFYREVRGERRYEITYREDGRQHWKTIGPNLMEARAALDDIRARIRRGETVTQSTEPFETVAWRWYELVMPTLKPATQDRYSVALRCHINPRLGRKKIGDVTADDIARLIRGMEKEGKKASTIRNALAPL